MDEKEKLLSKINPVWRKEFEQFLQTGLMSKEFEKEFNSNSFFQDIFDKIIRLQDKDIIDAWSDLEKSKEQDRKDAERN